MAAMDVFVHPSLTESLGHVTIEAMIAGTPVVATRVGGVPEIVEDGRTGLLVPPANPAAIAEQALRLHRDPVLRERLARAAREFAEQRFPIDAWLRHHVALYERCLNNR
jgi:glycosyltransferase involved in cell wall biosynthesis